MEESVKKLLDFANSKEANEILWLWYRCTTVGNYSSLDKKTKDAITCLYESLDMFFKEIE